MIFKRTLVNPVKNARYDDVYFKGIEWLDSLASEPSYPENRIPALAQESSQQEPSQSSPAPVSP